MAIEKNLIQRIVAGIVFLAIMIGCICFNQTSLIVLCIILGFAASVEFVNLIHSKIQFGIGRIGVILFLIILSSISALILFRTIDELLFFPILLIYFSAASVVLFLIKNENHTRIGLVFTHFISIFYCFFPFLALAILGWYDMKSESNFTVLYFFILIWTNDTMAYVVGRLIGKHKLAESISPKKTIEGFVGGIIFTTVVSVVLGIYFKNEFPNEIIFWIAPVLVAIFATVGDLFESAFKRWVGVKDSGNLIPGHGGILDRFDGALFAVWPYIALIIFIR